MCLRDLQTLHMMAANNLVWDCQELIGHSDCGGFFDLFLERLQLLDATTIDNGDVSSPVFLTEHGGYLDCNIPAADNPYAVSCTADCTRFHLSQEFAGVMYTDQLSTFDIDVTLRGQSCFDKDSFIAGNQRLQVCHTLGMDMRCKRGRQEADFPFVNLARIPMRGYFLAGHAAHLPGLEHVTGESPDPELAGAGKSRRASPDDGNLAQDGFRQLHAIRWIGRVCDEAMQLPNAQRGIYLRPYTYRLTKRFFGTNTATRLDEWMRRLKKGPGPMQVPATNRLYELGHRDVRRTLCLAWRIIAIET